MRNLTFIGSSKDIVKVKVFQNSLIMKVFPSQYVAVTIGHNVHFRGSTIYLNTLYHELAHVNQIENDGFWGFYVKYLWDYTKNLFRGMGFSDSYFQIPYEIEARKMQNIDPTVNWDN